MRSTETIDAALRDLFAKLDAEQFDAVAERLDASVELADEITGEWLRGVDRVGGYLRVQRDIVTDVTSKIDSIQSSLVTDRLGLVTFMAHQRYRLGGDPKTETLTGSALFAMEDEGDWLLRLLHLGEPSATTEETRNSGEPGGETKEKPKTPEESLGALMRGARSARGLSLRALGERTDLSPSLLSQIERGLSEPSLASLRRIADALGMSVGDLLGEAPAAPPGALVRRTTRRRALSPDIGALHELLSPEGDRLDARIVTLDAGVVSTSHAPHEGREFVFVVEGPLQLVINGEEMIAFTGDAATVDASRHHKIAATEQAPARFLWVSAPEA